MHIRDIQDTVHKNAADKGFWDYKPEGTVEEMHHIGTKLALIHSEVTEALEEIRKGHSANHIYYTYPSSLVEEVGLEQAKVEFAERGLLPKPEGFSTELADIIIRVLDLAGGMNIDMEAVIDEKLNYNASRDRLHGKSF